MAVLLREWRERRDLSLRELGERSGVSYVTIARIEAGTMSPTVATLDKLAVALGVGVRELLAPAARRRTSKKQKRRQR